MADPPSSDTGGILLPLLDQSTALIEGIDPLDIELQAIFAPLLGLPGAMVKPRYQPNPPATPDIEAEWAAVGAIRRTPDNSGNLLPGAQVSGQLSEASLVIHETFEALITAYGPASGARLDRLKVVLLISQNRYPMRAKGMNITSFGDVVSLPEQIGPRWRMRHDLTISMKRRIDRRFAIRNLEKASLAISNHPLSSEGD